MLLKGQVSTVDTENRRARVSFLGLGNVVSAELPYAQHVTLEVNDVVAVAFYSSNKTDGIIIAVH